ncbi:MAG TPA: ParB/RepB/Spo0J family partition protein [Candidatus Thiothrix moscowensis]|uniref:ParB/RepB/Spo0J family partition protein n=1 Tax=Thiothrix sp. UBA2016 TaxID=1947695 RepID=UPI0025E70736|nr:ParB/RepB/Spo0J family partition protein [Thiothrix sp. UBA2016]HRJ53098.1 ParB/RepB/Spo0J family partition protein [Candidatus Thiothrix moscowensis]HRJ93089.1 ParB/RepB/Spo0J family partition protein [Candidatus Thiothrix moscowensis]
MKQDDFGLGSLAAELEADTTVIAELLLHQISPDPEQPRRSIDPEKLQQLADSIKAQGVIQPIVVRNGNTFDNYIIVAGERRWRAAQIAGLNTIPAVVREFEQTALTAAQIIENIDREGFTLLDEVRAVMKMCELCGSAKAAGEALGKPKAWISQRVKIGTVGGIIETFIEEGDSTDVMGTYQLARFTEKHPEEGKQFIENWIQHPESRGSLREKVAELFFQMDKPKPASADQDETPVSATNSGSTEAVTPVEPKPAVANVVAPVEHKPVPASVQPDGNKPKAAPKVEHKPENVVNFRVGEEEVFLQTPTRTIVLNKAMLKVIHDQL